MAIKPCVKIEVAVMGPIENNVYIVEGPDATFVVDPTEQAPYIVELLRERPCAAIVLTHAHWDHVGAAAELRAITGAPVIASAVDAPIIDGSGQLERGHRRFDPCPVDRRVNDGETVEIGSMKWQAMVTPGHTPGSMCLFLDSAYGTDSDGVPVLISGDTLFSGAHGRTDFAGGDPMAMRESLRRLAELPGETLVLPGHNQLTTIELERPWMAGSQPVFR